MEDKARMSKYLPVRKFIFMLIAIFAMGYLYNNTRSHKKLPETQEAPQAAEIPEAPKAAEGATQDIKLGGPGEEQKILSFDMTGYTDEGKKKWDIKGESADVVSEVVVLNDIEANSYSADRTVELKADSGKFDKKENFVRLEDNVVVTTSDGITIKAEWFKWSSEANTIVTDSFVEVKKDNLYASGRGAVASTKDKEVRLEKDVTVKQDEITINCGGPLIIDYSNDKATFYGGVKVTEPRGEMTSDRLDIFFNRESRQMESAVAEGNVELRQGENVATGQKIVYTLASGEAVLTGNPEILIYSKQEIKDALTRE